MNKTVFMLALGLFIMYSAICFAGAPIPNLVGTWEEKSEKVVLTKGDKPGWEAKSITAEVRITEQKGRVIYGEVSTPKGKERIAGVISPDNKSVCWVDEDGSVDLKIISSEKMLSVHRHVLQNESAVVSGTLTRKKDKGK